MKLFHEYAGEPLRSTEKHWLFLAILIIGFGVLGFLVIAGVLWLIAALAR